MEQRLKILKDLIVHSCGNKPTGVRGISLWNKIRKDKSEFSIKEFEEMLRSLRTSGVLNVTNRLWRLTDYTKNNWQEINRK